MVDDSPAVQGLKGMMVPRKILVCLVILGVTVLCAHLLAGFYPVSYGAVGTRDGYQYWAALHVALSKGNPFDPSQSPTISRLQGYGEASIPIIRNPPWTAAFMVLWMWGNFSQAIWSWRFVQGLFLFLMWRLLVPSKATLHEKLVTSVVIVTFYPIGDSFHSGQLGIPLAFAVALFLRGSDAKSRVAEVTSLCIFLTKPHLFLPVFAYLFCMRRRSSLIFSGLVCIVLCVALFGAHSIADWINSMINPIHPELRTPLAAFKSNTFSAWCRGLLLGIGLGRSDFLIGVFAGLSLGVGCLIARCSRGFEVDAPLLILAGLFLAPYGWMSDYAILAPLLLSPLAMPTDRVGRSSILVGAFVILAGILVVPALQTTLTWVLILVVYYLIYRAPRSVEVAGRSALSSR